MTTAAIPVVTEQSNPLTQDLDIAGARGIVRLLRQTDSQIFSGWKTFDSVNDKPFLDNLEALCQAIYTHIKHKANKPVLAVITGAGTSGRLAFFCARSLNKLSERYNMNIEFRYLVAGNDLALIKSQEAAEDDTFQAVADLRNLINSKPYAHIIFIGVTCGLSAPYVGSQINWIMNTPEVDQQCTTILMGFNDPNAARNIPLEGWIRNGTTPIGPASENEQVPTMRSIVTELASRVGSGRHFLVTPVLGPEAVTGSSRMKGGTATKMLIEIIFAYSMQLSNNIPLLPDELPNGRRNIPHLLQSFERTARSTYIAEEDLGRVIQLAGDALKNNGHVFYLGEDSISILGLTDASECPPTYGARFDDIRGFVSGGWSIFGNRSGNLSHIDSCYKISDRDFLAYHAPQLTSNDVLIVLYAQGQSAENLHNIIEKTVSQTPVNVVLLCWRHQTKSTHFSSALANLRTHAKVVVDFQLPSFDLALQLPALLEISVKWALNAISTGAHVLKGKVWRNRMIDLTISNNKLYYRSAQIVADVAGVDLEFATTCLLKSIHGVDEVTDEIRQLPVSKQYEIAFPKKKVVPLAILLASKQFVTVDSAKRALEEDPIVRNTLLKIVKQ